jgi:hypothetical protein
VSGRIVVQVSPERQVLDGTDLEHWFVECGASVKVHSES